MGKQLPQLGRDVLIYQTFQNLQWNGTVAQHHTMEFSDVELIAQDAVNLLREFLNNHAHEISKLAAEYAADDGRKTIYPDDVRKAVWRKKMEEAEAEQQRFFTNIAATKIKRGG